MNSYSSNWNKPYESLIVTTGEFQKCNLPPLKLKFCFNLLKNATETYGMLQTTFGACCMSRASVFEWHKRFKEGREFVRDEERGWRSKEVNTPQLIGQRIRVRVTMLTFHGSSGRHSVGRGQISSNRVSGISSRTIHQSISPSLSLTIWSIWASRHFLSLPIVQILLPVTKVIDTLTQENFHEAFLKLLEQVHCSWRRLLRRGLVFHVCIINVIFITLPFVIH